MSFKFEGDYALAYADGCCLGNEQPDVNKRAAGIGVFFTDDNPLNVSQRAIETKECPPTNQNAEIQAATKAINVIAGKGQSYARIYTDSQFVIDCATKWMSNWKANRWVKANGDPVENKWALQRLGEAMERLPNPVSWKKVDAHQSMAKQKEDYHAYGNDKANELAQKGAKKPKN